jgi:hypothetical protein
MGRRVGYAEHDGPFVSGGIRIGSRAADLATDVLGIGVWPERRPKKTWRLLVIEKNLLTRRVIFR